jgi:hypothetical protein
MDYLLSAPHTAGVNESPGELVKQEKQKPQTYRVLLRHDMPSSVMGALSSFSDEPYILHLTCAGFVIYKGMFMPYESDGTALFLLCYEYILTIEQCESDV